MVGISRSVTTTAGRSRSAVIAPSAPSRASSTSKPAPRRVRARMARVTSLSSTTRTRRFTAPPSPQARTSVRASARGGSAMSAAPALQGHPRHAEDDRARLVLHQGDAAGLAQREQPLDAVGAHAGHQHAGHLARAALGAGEEQVVDRRAVAAPGRGLGVEAQHAAGLQAQMGAARGQPHGAAAQRLAVLGQADVEGELLVEPVGEAQLEAGGDVLDDQEADRRVRRHLVEQLADGRRPAGRGADRHPAQLRAAAAARAAPGRVGRACRGGARRGLRPRPRRARSRAGSRRAAASSACPRAWAAPPGRRAASPRRRSASGCGWRARRGRRSASAAPP